MRVGPKRRRWGTWEELILGGAVIRHGTQDWNVVASELRTRIVSPYGFTPEVSYYINFFYLVCCNLMMLEIKLMNERHSLIIKVSLLRLFFNVGMFNVIFCDA